MLPRILLSAALLLTLGSGPVAAARDQLVATEGTSHGVTRTAQWLGVTNVLDLAKVPPVHRIIRSIPALRLRTSRSTAVGGLSSDPARLSSDLARLSLAAGSPPVVPSSIGASSLLPLVASPSLASGQTAALVSDGSFAGLDDNQPVGCHGRPCVEPPDPWIAVGPNHIVQAVNVSLRITDRTGASALTTDLASFMGVTPDDKIISDPRVIYDPAHQRWVAVLTSMNCVDGALYLSVSQTADPTGGWTHLKIAFPGRLPDFPGLGTSSDKIVLSANEFPIDPSAKDCLSSAGRGSSLEVFDWADVLNGSATYTTFPASRRLQVWRPALGLSSTATIHAIAEASDGTVVYMPVTGTNAAGTVAFGPQTSLPIRLTEPPFPTQPGTPSTIAEATDERPTDALWRNGHLWFVNTGSCTFAVARACIHAFDVATGSTPTVKQDITVGDGDSDSFVGGIGLAQNGTTFIVYTNSSATSAASTYATFHLPTDAPGTAHPPILIQAGSGTYPGTRWGDYLGVATDPVDPGAVWEANEVAAAPGWATWVSKLSVAIQGPPAVGVAFRSEPFGGIAEAALSSQPSLRIIDASGATVASGSMSTAQVTLSLAPNPVGATLTCTDGLVKPAVAGVVSFDGCTVSTAGAGYAIVASAQGLQPATSDPFVVVPPGTSQASLAMSATPSSIVIGGAVSLSATVTSSIPEISVAQRGVTFQASIDGTAWSTIGTSTTDATGVATLSHKPTTHLYYRAIYAGDMDLAPALSPAARVVVRQSAVLKPAYATTKKISRGTRITFTISVRPVVPGAAAPTVRFVLYRRVGSSWTLYRARVLATVSGRATITWSFSTVGGWYVRARANATALDAASAWTPIERFAVR